MISMQTAWTDEPDEFEEAIESILGQLNLDLLKKNSVGIIFCHFDFIESEIVNELSKKLPFEIIGMTTMASTSNGEINPYTLRLAVLTSDEIKFHTAITKSLDKDNYYRDIESAYQKACAGMSESPALIIAFFPYLASVSGSDLADAFDIITKGIPTWGSLSSGIDMSYKECRTIGAFGDVDQNGMSMILFEGDVTPKFYVTSISEKKIRENKAYITNSEGCLLREVNDIPVLEYLDKLGISIQRHQSTTVPFMVDYGDGAPPIALGVFTINDDGSLIMGGQVPVGSAITLGEIDNESILDTACITLDKVFEDGTPSAALMLPCVTRYIMLAPTQNAEMQLVIDRAEVFPYMIGYSGGEVCPVLGSDGKYHNRFHNYTFTAVVF